MTAISLKNISFGYTTKNIFSNFNLSIEKGQLTSILGANGAGKTTLIQLMLNQLSSAQGSIEVFGKSADDKALKQRIGALQQNATAPEKIKVRELIQLFSSYYTEPFSFDTLVEKLNLEPLLDKLFADLSGGQKQVTLLALAVCGNPDLLFLDEPSVGMDIELRRKIWTFVESLKKQGKTIILTTHYMEEAEQLSDQIVVLSQGQVVLRGTPNQIKAQTVNKVITCKTNLSEQEVLRLPNVISAKLNKHEMEVLSEHAETTLKQWFTVDPDLSDLAVSKTSLENAFLQILNTQSATNDSKESNS